MAVRFAKPVDGFVVREKKPFCWSGELLVLAEY